MCCFYTGSDVARQSRAGEPPDGEPRLSIAMYYYTATWDDSRVAHSTLFRPRPGSSDAAANRAHRKRLVQEILPPVIYRRISGPLGRLGL